MAYRDVTLFKIRPLLSKSERSPIAWNNQLQSNAYVLTKFGSSITGSAFPRIFARMSEDVSNLLDVVLCDNVKHFVIAIERFEWSLCQYNNIQA